MAWFVPMPLLLFVHIAWKRRFHITVGTAKGPWAKQICSEIRTDPRSIVINSLARFTLLKFVCPTHFTIVFVFQLKWDVKGLTLCSTISWFIVNSRGGFVPRHCFFCPLCVFPGSHKRNGSFANMPRRVRSAIITAVEDLWQDYLWDPANTINPAGAVIDSLAGSRQRPPRAQNSSGTKRTEKKKICSKWGHMNDKYFKKVDWLFSTAQFKWATTLW